MKLSNVLQNFERNETLEVGCGDTWKVKVRQVASYNRGFQAAIAKHRAKAGKILEEFIDIDSTSNFEKGLENVEFFCDYILAGWTGLIDDDGEEIPYTPENVKAVFIDQYKQFALMPSNPIAVLVEKLFKVALDDKLFVVVREQTEEAIKN